MDDNKRRALASALSQIEKQFGKGAVMRMGDHSYEGIETISTGSLGACRGGASSKSMARNPRARPR